MFVDIEQTSTTIAEMTTTNSSSSSSIQVLKDDAAVEEGESKKRKGDPTEETAMSTTKRKQPSEIANGAYCSIFSSTDSNTVDKVMTSDKNEGVGCAQMKECNFYLRLESILPQFIQCRFAGASHNIEDDSVTVTLRMEKKTGDLWNMRKWWKKNAPNLVKTLVDDVTVALSRLHNSKLLHRDLKPGNILTDEKNFFLIDVGSSNFIDVSTRTSGHCTYTFCSPESEPSSGSTDTIQSDIYSFGATLICLILNYFCSDDFIDWKRVSRMNTWPTYAQNFKPILQRCVEHHPALRPSLLQIREAFGITTSLIGMHLPFKEWPVPTFGVLFDVMKASSFDWRSEIGKNVDWMMEIVIRKRFSKFTFISTVRCIYDLFVYKDFGIRGRIEFSLYCFVCFSLCLKCFEDNRINIDYLLAMCDGVYSSEEIVQYEMRAWKCLDYVTFRRSISSSLLNLSSDILLKYVKNNII